MSDSKITCLDVNCPERKGGPCQMEKGMDAMIFSAMTTANEGDLLTEENLNELMVNLKKIQPDYNSFPQDIRIPKGLDLAKLLNIAKQQMVPEKSAMMMIMGMPVYEDPTMPPGVFELRWSNGQIYRYTYPV